MIIENYRIPQLSKPEFIARIGKDMWKVLIQETNNFIILGIGLIVKNHNWNNRGVCIWSSRDKVFGVIVISAFLVIVDGLVVVY